MKSSSLCVFFLLLLFLVPCASAQVEVTQSNKLSDAEQKAVDRAVSKFMFESEAVGVSVGVLRDRKVAYLKGYGESCRKRETPVTTETIFNWASNSKPVVAVLAMQLVEQGKLDLDQSVRELVPELPKSNHDYTVRHLLCHQSGYPHYSNGRVIRMSDEIKTVKEELDPSNSLHRFGNSPLIDKPGNQYSYSSYAYVILSVVVQRAGEEPIADQIRKRIAEPVGWSSFQLDLPYDNQANWAMGYARGPLGHIIEIPDTAHFWKHGAGGYKSDIEDFALWAKALLNGDLVSKDIEQQMWTRQRTNDNKQTAYGLGFRIEGRGQNRSIGHGGSQQETKTHLKIYPEKGTGFVVLCNSSYVNPADLVGRIEAALKEVEDEE